MGGRDEKREYAIIKVIKSRGENMSKKSEYIVKHPHDAFFKKTFSKKEIAVDFLKNYLPEKILEHINLETLTNQNGEYIDKNLKKDFSDLLYQVEIDGREGYIYILFEHKSYEDEKVIFQLLRYMTKIWEERFDSKRKKAPIIIPLVIYHGKKGSQGDGGSGQNKNDRKI